MLFGEGCECWAVPRDRSATDGLGAEALRALMVGVVDPGPFVSPLGSGGETLIQPLLQSGTVDGQTKKPMNPRSSRSL